ncbi:MAG: hypothetical protein KAX40_05510 [Herpetosiphon sp.]|nr:hypothetical protein [Herpetosiphon sp.]
MTTTVIDVQETPTTLEELLSMTKKGTEIVLTYGDETLARLIPATIKKPRIGNLNPNSIIVGDDFDDPLPDEFWLGEA